MSQIARSAGVVGWRRDDAAGADHRLGDHGTGSCPRPALDHSRERARRRACTGIGGARARSGSSTAPGCAKPPPAPDRSSSASACDAGRAYRGQRQAMIAGGARRSNFATLLAPQRPVEATSLKLVCPPDPEPNITWFSPYFGREHRRDLPRARSSAASTGREGREVFERLHLARVTASMISCRCPTATPAQPREAVDQLPPAVVGDVWAVAPDDDARTVGGHRGARRHGWIRCRVMRRERVLSASSRRLFRPAGA